MLKQLLLLPFPVAESSLELELNSQEVFRRLSRQFSLGEVILQEGYKGWSKKRFTGTFSHNNFQIIGPFGNKEWTLVTDGTISRTPTGSTIHLSFRLATFQLVTCLGVLFFYFSYAYYYLGFGMMWPVLAFQVLFLYTVIICVFHSQISRLKNWLNYWIYDH